MSFELAGCCFLKGGKGWQEEHGVEEASLWGLSEVLEWRYVGYLSRKSHVSLYLNAWGTKGRWVAGFRERRSLCVCLVGIVTRALLIQGPWSRVTKECSVPFPQKENGWGHCSSHATVTACQETVLTTSPLSLGLHQFHGSKNVCLSHKYHQRFTKIKG